jgi:hypothetical protein
MVEPTSKISEKNYLFREPAELWISEKEEIPIDPYSLFILAIRSPVIMAKYLQRMGYFLDFLEMPKSDDHGSIISFENRINGFAQRARANVNWLTNSIVMYLHGHKQRVERRDYRVYLKKSHQAYQAILRCCLVQSVIKLQHLLATL